MQLMKGDPGLVRNLSMDRPSFPDVSGMLSAWMAAEDVNVRRGLAEFQVADQSKNSSLKMNMSVLSHRSLVSSRSSIHSARCVSKTSPRLSSTVARVANVGQDSFEADVLKAS